MDLILLVVSVWDERALYRGGVNEVCRFMFVVGIDGAFDGTTVKDEEDLRRDDDGTTIHGLLECDRLLRRPARVNYE